MSQQGIGRGILGRRNHSTDQESTSSGLGIVARLRSLQNGEVNNDSIRSRLRNNPKPTQHFIMMSEAAQHVTQHTRTVVILPPSSGDLDVPTDEEDF